MAVSDVSAAARPRGRDWTEVLHEWVSTVDHKKLGIMYVTSGIIFFVIAGLQAVLMRYQLAFPENDFLHPDVFNRRVLAGRTLLVGDPALEVLLALHHHAQQHPRVLRSAVLGARPGSVPGVDCPRSVREWRRSPAWRSQ